MAITLKAARVNKGFTQKKAAELLNVSEDKLSNWERHKSFPDAEEIERIMSVYGLTYDQINFLPNTTV